VNRIANIIRTGLVVIAQAVLRQGCTVLTEVAIADGTGDVVLTGDVIGTVCTAVDLVTGVGGTADAIITL